MYVQCFGSNIVYTFSNNNNNNFIYTLDSEVKLCLIAFTGSNAVQLINKHSDNTTGNSIVPHEIIKTGSISFRTVVEEHDNN